MKFLKSEVLRKYIRRVCSLIFGKKPTIHCIPFGPNKGRKIFMSVDISPRMFFGIDEPWIAQLTRQYVQPGNVVYDIGAHVGYTSLLFAQYVGDVGLVHAFEILPSVAENFLRKTVLANKFMNIVVHSIGLSNKEETLELPIGETMMTSLYQEAEGRKTELCKTTTLDLYASQEYLPFPSLIKIDIEGAEIDCLSGGIGLINKCCPIMIIEFHNIGLLEKGHSLLTSLGYILTLQHGTIDGQLFQDAIPFHESVLCLPT
jgi:FkbM family methyltransferase